MVTKTQLAFVLMTCAVMALLIQPGVSQQKNGLRWGKRDSGLPDEYEPEIPHDRRRQYDNEEDYYSKPASLIMLIKTYAHSLQLERSRALA